MKSDAEVTMKICKSIKIAARGQSIWLLPPKLPVAAGPLLVNIKQQKNRLDEHPNCLILDILGMFISDPGLRRSASWFPKFSRPLGDVGCATACVAGTGTAGTGGTAGTAGTATCTAWGCAARGPMG